MRVLSPASARGAMFRGVLGSRASARKGELFAQGAEPDRAPLDGRLERILIKLLHLGTEDPVQVKDTEVSIRQVRADGERRHPR
jgi:hypothetical protein